MQLTKGVPAHRTASNCVDPRAVLQAASWHAVVTLRHIELPRRPDQQRRPHSFAKDELCVIGCVVRLDPEPVLVVEHEGLVGPRDLLVCIEKAPAWHMHVCISLSTLLSAWNAVCMQQQYLKTYNDKTKGNPNKCRDYLEGQLQQY